jgi:UDPglucose 6-dehydrogenase
VVAEQLRERGVDIEFDVASNPEFLKEGRAVRDFMMPDRVVVGVESERARALMHTLYSPLMMTDRLLFSDIVTAEMTKYAANAMLATRISFMNDMANLCELTGANIDMVRKGIGADARIGSKFLYAGCGYGGSCFPKDVRALIATAESLGYSMEVVKAVERVNNRQKRVLFEKLQRHYGGDMQGLQVAVWGLSFKPDTDDLREAPSLVLIDALLEAGCRVKVFDPVAMDNARAIYGDKIEYTSNIYEAATDADALVVVTEWKEFRLPAWPTLKRVMRGRVIADGRNIYDAGQLASLGFTYYRIG